MDELAIISGRLDIHMYINYFKQNIKNLECVTTRVKLNSKPSDALPPPVRKQQTGSSTEIILIDLLCIPQQHIYLNLNTIDSIRNSCNYQKTEIVVDGVEWCGCGAQ